MTSSSSDIIEDDLCLDYDGASFMAVLQVVASSNQMTKRRALEVFIDMAYSKSTFLTDCTKQKSWQVSAPSDGQSVYLFVFF